MNVIEGKLNLTGNERVAVIASRFNHLITDRLVEGARDSFVRHGGKDEHLDLILVPGAFELPFALEKVLAQGDYDGVCCLGAIIRGSTPHFDYVSAEATKGIANVTLKYGAAVTFGVLTTDNIEQAIERAGTKVGNKGFEAMTGLIEMMNLYKNIGA
ncbi:6,7-dimethyl-8-ribityllumazine synthase [Wolinella succinogenes]|uniref:6,7-dimethyl-8-ribityllumazine synthase n=1 Tax=Wolinella succinogenes (strain ATCC 29543 / DSM 1740 / CCUG 13145 / JCM 31913 / LMG 7466 / NCTC 11488 / FDC 602W) TaxID=273121 RepID=RISB_WOLSU|nr:6,7-dimethyl-8-ribityllumazine synthase [Wolinella succinogenes]Q7MAF0.1 RecName: Full=6,7-dimethyl-8-ribityllumazine synthase; Short=DMRL synthase; Short=LS; Short=Lumazine synthase [Wolinella succinogenes DSM 1740]HCZ19870.1 6,7-dimethyl-8-ribityllumazine synthase [Helicobacter sp.]NLU35382.1 6,7-dimethyl-8-ribityllumazine synthase [Wolinella succinogenes]CAE09446.1 RIBOFLAVIN SYNTHASE [Wolinella succinogenes]VEG81659.1 6,7-dimethyl-8-ribityllumazine synthase [Wolinella succinogenes]